MTWKPPTSTRIRPANVEMPKEAPPATGIRFVLRGVRLGIGAPREGGGQICCRRTGSGVSDVREHLAAAPHPKRAPEILPTTGTSSPTRGAVDDPGGSVNAGILSQGVRKKWGDVRFQRHRNTGVKHRAAPSPGPT